MKQTITSLNTVVLLILLSLTMVCQIFPSGINVAEAATYHVSNSGNDSNDGFTPSTAWRTFYNVNNLTLQPGDQVLLARGSVWNQELNLTGNGTFSQPIRLNAYGSGMNPRISRTYGSSDQKCAVINNPSHWIIENIIFQNAKLGLYLRYYNSFNNQNVTVQNCQFYDMGCTKVDEILAQNNYEFAWSSGIFLGGMIPSSDSYSTVLTGWKVWNNYFQNSGNAVLTNFYFPPVNRQRIKSVDIQYNDFAYCLGGGISMNFAQGVVKNNTIL